MNMGDLVLNERSTCLVVVDIQNDIVHPDGHFPKLGFWNESYDGIVDRIAAFAAALPPRVRRVYTRTVYEPDGSDGIVRRHRIIPGQFYERGVPRPVPTCVRGTWGVEILDQLKPRPEDVVISKRRYSAFYGTDFEILLRSWGIETLLLVGVNAEQCVETTARDAFMRDFDVVAVDDCLGSWGTARLQASKEVIAYAFGCVTDAQTVCKALAR
jgi:ureidoacrylate peracid hydrolase